jgi:hypothetical protein
MFLKGLDCDASVGLVWQESRRDALRPPAKLYSLDDCFDDAVLYHRDFSPIFISLPGAIAFSRV